MIIDMNTVDEDHIMQIVYERIFEKFSNCVKDALCLKGCEDINNNYRLFIFNKFEWDTLKPHMQDEIKNKGYKVQPHNNLNVLIKFERYEGVLY